MEKNRNVALYGLIVVGLLLFFALIRIGTKLNDGHIVYDYSSELSDMNRTLWAIYERLGRMKIY